MLVTVGSCTAAPGATTTGLLLAAAWRAEDRRAVMVEADPDGGRLAARLGLVEDGVSLVTLAAASRRTVTAEVVEANARTVGKGLAVVPAPVSPARMTGAVRQLNSAAGRLAGAVTDAVVVVDVGRLRDGSPNGPLCGAADVVVVVCRPVFEELVGVFYRLEAWAGWGPLAVVTVGSGSYGGDQIDGELRDRSGGRAWWAGELPFDPRGVAGLVSAGWAPRTARSALGRAGRRLVDALDGALSRPGADADAGSDRDAEVPVPAAGVPVADVTVNGAGPAGGHDELVDELVVVLRERVSAWAQAQRTEGRVVTDDDQRVFGEEVTARWLEELAARRLAADLDPLEAAVEDRLASDGWARAFGLGDFEPCTNPEFADVHLSGHEFVKAEDRLGNTVILPPLFSSTQDMVEQLRRIAAVHGEGRRWDASSWRLDMGLPSGTRITAIFSPPAQVPIVRFRNPPAVLQDLDDLQATGMFDDALASFLRAAIEGRFNVVLAGQPGAGKTTLGRAMLHECGPDESIYMIESSRELLLHKMAGHPDVVSVEARAANVDGAGAVSLLELAEAALRMNPSRVVVAEAKGAEVLTMFHAMGSGVRGSLCTLHAASTKETFGRLEMYASMTEQNYDPAWTRTAIAASIDFVVQCSKLGGQHRAVSSVRQVTGVEGDEVTSIEVWGPGPDGRARLTGQPFRHETMARLLDAGFDRSLCDGPGGWG